MSTTTKYKTTKIIKQTQPTTIFYKINTKQQ